MKKKLEEIYFSADVTFTNTIVHYICTLDTSTGRLYHGGRGLVAK